MKLFLSIYRFFFKRSQKEQVFICGLLWIALIWIGFGLLTKAFQLKTKKGSLQQTLTQQNHWLSQSKTLNSELLSLTQQIDSKKTLNPTQLVGHVEDCLKTLQVPYTISPIQTQHGQHWDTHTLKIHLEHITIEKSVSIQNAFLAEKPYLDIHSIELHAEDSSGATLSGSFVLKALQFKSI